MIYEILDSNGDVTNTIVASAEFMQENYQQDRYRLTDTPVGNVVDTVPNIVTMRQARLALLEQGILDQVQPAIDSLSSPNKEQAQISWDYSSTVERNNSFVAVLAVLLNLSQQDLDNLFILAASK